jgi:penicillin-binding protein 2
MLPDSNETLMYINKALAGVVTGGTAAWRFGGWPQDKITLHAKTGTAEVQGKQTTSWFATYTKDYAVIMTISQGGTGSGGSGPAVRKIYEAMYGVQKDGSIDSKKALLPHPATTLPSISADGSVVQKAAYDVPSSPQVAGGGTVPAALTRNRSAKLLLGRRYCS